MQRLLLSIFLITNLKWKGTILPPSLCPFFKSWFLKQQQQQQQQSFHDPSAFGGRKNRPLIIHAQGWRGLLGVPKIFQRVDGRDKAKKIRPLSAPKKTNLAAFGDEIGLGVGDVRVFVVHILSGWGDPPFPPYGHVYP